MAQKIKVQDGIVVYEATDPQYDLSFGITGVLNVTQSAKIGTYLNVGNINLSSSSITTTAGSNLTLTTGINGNLSISPLGSLLFNGFKWPESGSANVGAFLGTGSTANALSFYPFIFASVTSDILTVTGLNTAYPNIQSGQSISGPTVIYQCITSPTPGPGEWFIVQPNLGYIPVNNTGDIMSGPLILSADPTNNLGAVTKQYVDQIATSINIHSAARTATTTTNNLTSNSYISGSQGVGGGLGIGATLTALSDSYINDIGIGGYTTLAVGDRILVKNQSNSVENGVYVITDLGASATTGTLPARPWMLTRTSDYNNSQINQVHPGNIIYVESGVLSVTQWVEIGSGTGPNSAIIIGTDNINFEQFAGSGTLTSGTGINISGNTISNTGVLSNTSGAGILLSSNTGNIIISNNGVLSITAGNNIGITSNTGNITVSVTGTVPHAVYADTIAISATTPTPTNAPFYITLVPSTIGNQTIDVDEGFSLNPATGGLIVPGTITVTSGTITNLLSPVNSTDAATKAYVDAATTSANVHPAVEAASTVNLPAIYLNGTSGVGASLTNSGDQLAFTIDGYSNFVTGDRVLIKNQTDATQNGIYNVTTIGTSSTNWVLTRARDYDNSSAGGVAAGDLIFVGEGTTQASTSWIQIDIGTGIYSGGDYIIIGTDAIVFTQFSGAGTYLAGTGLSLVGNTFSNTGVISITSNSGLSTNTSTTGNVTITNTGVTSLLAGSNISVSNSTGIITVAVVGTIPTATTAIYLSGTTQYSIPYQSGPGTTAYLSPGTLNQVIISNGTGAAPSYTSTPTFTGLTVTGPNTPLLINSTNNTSTKIQLQDAGITRGYWSANATQSLAVIDGSDSFVTFYVDQSGNGNFTGNVTATSFTGDGSKLTGISGGSSSTTVTTSTTNTNCPLVLSSSGISGTQSLLMDTNITINPNTNILTTTGAFSHTGSQGTAYWLTSDGQGRQHWYWNTAGTNTPTILVSNEDTMDLMMTSTTGLVGSLTATITGTVMTVTVAPTAALSIGYLLSGPGIAASTYITSFGTGTGTSTGTYNINISTSIPTAESITFTTTQAIYTGSIAGTTLTVSSLATGGIALGQFITGAGITSGTYITTGFGASWTVNIPQTVSSMLMMNSSGPVMNFRTATGLNQTAGAAINWQNTLSVQNTGSMLLSPLTVNSTLTTSGLSILGVNATQASPSATTIAGTSSVQLGGMGGNALFIGQYPTSNIIWVQSSYTNPTTAVYPISIQPLGGNVGIGTGAVTPVSTLQVVGIVTATSFSGSGSGLTGIASSLTVGNAILATNITAGLANQIPYQTGSGSTAFITAPTTPSTFLEWNGTAFIWSTAGSAGSINNTPIGATTPSTGAFTSLSSTADATIHGLTIGLGGGTNSTNTVVGNAAMPNSTSGNNTAIGYSTLLNTTSGGSNTALGSNSLYSNTTGTYNTAVGVQSGYTQLPANANKTGASNTWIGYQAGPGVSTVINSSIAIGLQAVNTLSNQAVIGSAASIIATNLFGTLTVSQAGGSQIQISCGPQLLPSNMIIGNGALVNATSSASQTTILGQGSGNSITSGAYNTAMGNNALYSATTSGANTAIGYSALFSTSTSTGFNTAVGFQAGYTSTASNANVSGIQNTYIGASAGPGTSTQLSNSMALGYGALVLASNSIQLGNSSVTSVTTSGSITSGALTVTGAITATGNITAYYSDKRLKDIIGTIPNALSKVLSISGILYTPNSLAASFGYSDTDQQAGVIAQEIQRVLPEAVHPAPFDTDKDGNSKSGDNYLTVQYERLVPLLIEAIKEQNTYIVDLEFKLNAIIAKLGI